VGKGLPDWETEFDLQEVDRLAGTLLTRYRDLKIWLLEGALGAGKTTLVKALCKRLGVNQEATSPTFSLVNSYESESQSIIYHLDLYRLSNLEQAAEIGLYEITDSGYFCLIEWASAIGYQPADSSLLIHIDHLHQTKRRISVWIQ